MRRPARRPLARARRGVTLPFVCVMLTAVLGGVALAVDMGRVYLTAGEAQAAADAAAIAGGRFLQQYTGYYAGSINTAYGMAAVSPLNRVAGAPSQVTSYQPVTYDPVANTISASSWSSATSAVTVAVSARPTYAFAGALGLTPPTVSRKATAWVANLSGAACVRPFALPYTRFYEIGIDDHNTVDSTYTRRGAVAPEYNAYGVATLQPIYPFNNSPLGRTYTAIPQWEQENVAQWSAKSPTPPQNDSGRVVMGRWIPVDFSGGGITDFQTFLSAAPGSSSCQAAAAQDGTAEAPLAGFSNGKSGSQQRTLLNAMAVAMAQLCHRTGNAPDAHCYNSDGSVGVRVRVFLADSLQGGGPGGFRVNTREVTMVRIMCYFQSASDVCAPTTIKDENSTTASASYWSMASAGAYPHGYQGNTPPPTAYYGYPAGTISVVLDGPTNIDVTSDLTWGTKPAITQRVFLVR